MLRVVVLVGVVDLAERVASANVLVVFVDFRVDLVLEGAFLVQRDVFEVDLREDRVALIHHLYLLVLQRELQVPLRLTDIHTDLG